MSELTDAQVRALKMIQRRDWPAGEPKKHWINTHTWKALHRLRLVEERFPGSAHLTDAGRAALSKASAPEGE